MTHGTTLRIAAQAVCQEVTLISIPVKMPKLTRRRCVAGAMVVVLAAGAVGAYQGLWRYHLKRFTEVADGALYRSAQPTKWGIRHLVRYHGVKTVVCLRREDARLKTWFDFKEADGPLESAYVEDLDGQFLHWQLGGEAYWPWLPPTFFEAYFKLMDDPANLPVAVHCVGGRHRTGTFSALYRLEYDRWPVEQVLEEMYSYNFGAPVAVHEHNLRTYRVRPRPSAAQWQQLAAEFAGAGPVEDYDALVRRITGGQHPQDIQVLQTLLEQGQPFAVCLAERVIDAASHPVVPAAVKRAEATLAADDASPEDWASAAALVADWGEPEQQRQLLQLLENEPREGQPSARYRALVVGVTNRYSPNRVPYLVPLLTDERYRPEPEAAAYRYCHTAAARLVSITNEPLIPDMIISPAEWDALVVAARQYVGQATELCQLRQFQPELFERFHRAMTGVGDKDDYRE